MRSPHGSISSRTAPSSPKTSSSLATLLVVRCVSILDSPCSLLTSTFLQGNLALALARYLRDYRPLSKEGLFTSSSPIADSLLLFSPWVDLSLSHASAGPSSSFNKHAKFEFLTIEGCITARDRLVVGLPPSVLRSRWMSAVCINRETEEDLFDNFPRCIVVSGCVFILFCLFFPLVLML